MVFARITSHNSVKFPGLYDYGGLTFVDGDLKKDPSIFRREGTHSNVRTFTQNTMPGIIQNFIQAFLKIFTGWGVICQYLINQYDTHLKTFFGAGIVPNATVHPSPNRPVHS